MSAEVAALLALSKSTSNQVKFMQPSSNSQQARQFWQHAVMHSKLMLYNYPKCFIQIG